MKTLIKLTLAVVMFAATFAAQAGWVSGYVRSNGTYVAPHYRSSSGSLGPVSDECFTPDCLPGRPIEPPAV